MSEKKTTQHTDETTSIKTAVNEVTLPFAEERDKLTKVFVRNAIPREDDYQRLLKQHGDMAYSLGLEKGPGAESKQGDGLLLNTDTKKLEVKHDNSLKKPGGVLGINPKADGGIDTAITNGLAVKLNTTSVTTEAGVIRAGSAGLNINVGTGTSRRGLTGVSLGTSGVVLGVDHDASLRINTANGKLGVNPNNSDVAVRMMGAFYGASHYVRNDFYTIYLRLGNADAGDYLSSWNFIAFSNVLSNVNGVMFLTGDDYDDDDDKFTVHGRSVIGHWSKTCVAGICPVPFGRSITEKDAFVVKVQSLHDYSELVSISGTAEILTL